MQLSYNQSSRSQRHQHQQWHQQQQQQLVAPFLGGDPHIPLAPGASSMVLNLEGFEVCERLLLLLPFVTIALLCKFGCDCHAHYRQCEHKGKVANAIGKASTAFVTAEANSRMPVCLFFKERWIVKGRQAEHSQAIELLPPLRGW
eukprot:scaffold49192_cov18-Tisochrysis_lutea.AAC.3